MGWRADGWEVVEGFHPAPGRELPLRPGPARCRAAPSAVPHRMPGHYNHFTSIPPPTGGMWVGGVSQCTGHLTNRWVVSHSALVTSQTGGWCPTVDWSPHLIAALSLSNSPSLASQQVIFNVIIIVNVGQSNPFRCWQLFMKLITSPVLAGLCLVGSVWHFCRG